MAMTLGNYRFLQHSSLIAMGPSFLPQPRRITESDRNPRRLCGCSRQLEYLGKPEKLGPRHFCCGALKSVRVEWGGEVPANAARVNSIGHYGERSSATP